MDFAVPDQVPPVGPSNPTLLRSRGADPLVEIPTAHFLRAVAGLPFQPVPGSLSSTPNALPYSFVEAILGPIIAVDKTVTGGVHEISFLGTLILPAKFEAALAQAFLEAPNVRLDPNAHYTSLSAAAAAILDFADRLDTTALHPSYVLNASDTYGGEPALGTTPASFRSLFIPGSAITYGSLANESGFLIHLGFLGFIMFGRAVSSARDTPSSPVRSTIAQIESMSMAADLLRTGANLSSTTLRHWLDLTTLPGGLVSLTEIGTGTDRREQCLRDRHLFVYGDLGQKESILAGLVLRDPLRTRLPNISRVLGRNCSPIDARVSILRMVRSISNSATADMANIATLENLEPTLRNLITTLTMPSLTGANLSQRVDAVVKAAVDTGSFGTSGASSAVAASASTASFSIDRAKPNLFADELASAMGRNDWRVIEAQLSAELALPCPSSLKLHDLIVNSPVLGARRLALGSKDTALYPVLGLSRVLNQALIEMDDFHTIASLMLVCDLATMSVTESHLISFRLSEKTTTALRRGAFDEINWVSDVLVEVMLAMDPSVNTDPFPNGLYDARVLPQLEPLMQRVSRLLGLPLQPPPPPPPVLTTTLALAGAPPAVAPLLFASLSHIISTIAAENIDITGHPSPFDDDYLTKLKHFETTAWREASTEFQKRVVSAKNPAGKTMTTVLPQTSAARGILALMRATKRRNRDDAHSNPTTHALLTAFRASGSPALLAIAPPVPQRSSDRSHSRSRSPDGTRSMQQADAHQRHTALVTAGSRVASTLFFAADGSSFWYTSPETRQRASPVYDFETLENIAGKTRYQLDFPVLLSTMPPHKRMSLCAHSHLKDHYNMQSAAHQLPFANFLDQVQQHFQGPAVKNISPAVGTQGEQNNHAPDDRGWRSNRHRSRRPPTKSPNPDDARRSHRQPLRSALVDTSDRHRDTVRDRKRAVVRSRSASPGQARSPSRSASRDRSRSPQHAGRYGAAPADPPVQTADEPTTAQAASADTHVTTKREPSPSPHGSPRSRGSTSQRSKWATGLLAAGGAHGAETARNVWRDAPPMLNLLDPAHSVVRTILLVVALAADSPMRLLVPPNLDHVIGLTTSRSAPRAAAVATAQVLAAALHLPGVDLATHCIPIAERIPSLGDVTASVDRIVALPLSRIVARAAMRAALSQLEGWQWLTLGALGGLAVYAFAALTFARVRSYFPSSSVASARRLLEHQSNLRSGGREHAVASSAASRRRATSLRKRAHDASGPPDAQWSSALSDMAAADVVLRRMLLAIPDSDPDAQGLRAFADLLRPLNEEEVPPSFKAAQGLPSFRQANLFLQPFSVRVGPPRTAWLPRRPPQPAPPPDFTPQSLKDLLEPYWFDQLSRWYADLGAWLLNLSEAAKAGGQPLERMLASRPPVLVVPASGFVPAARGTIWDLRHGAPKPVDFTVPIDTHLNLQLISKWMHSYPDFPDRELFSHLLEGVRFKTAPATQIVLQPHLSSLAQGFVSVHRELVRLTEKGFFQTFTHPPYAPWVTLPMGVAFRKLEPDRPRRTTDGGAPRKGTGASRFLVDADGVRVLPLNLLAHHPADDVLRGTATIFTDAWKQRLDDADCRPPNPHSALGARLRPLQRRPSGPRLSALLLFSGLSDGPDTLARQLAALHIDVLAVDRRVHGDEDDMSNPAVLANCLSLVASGAYSFVFIATPCSSYSVAVDGTRPQLRSRTHPRGLPSCPDAWRAYIQRHNALADATVACILAAERSSTPWAVENPAARWDTSSPAHWAKFRDWGTLWDVLAAAGIAPARLLPPTVAPQARGVLEATFAACAFGAPFQKYTTVWASQGASSLTAHLRDRPCLHAHDRHAEVLQGRLPSGSGAAAEAAAYVPALAAALASGIDAVIHAAALARSLALSVRPASPHPRRPSVSSQPAPPALRPGHLIDVDITRAGSTPLLSNPFKLGGAGKDERLRQLAVVIYSDWLDLRTVSAAAMCSALPVAQSMCHTTGDDVHSEVHRIVTRYGPRSAFNLVCGSRCRGKLCHGSVLAALFEQVADSTGDLPFPKELKPTVPEIMTDLAVLMHLSALTSIPVYQIVSDVKDFFNQHYLAPEEAHKVGLVTLDPRAIVAYAESLRAAEPDLASIAEDVLGYGLACASNICQRTAHLLTFVWEVEMQIAAAATVRALRRRYPALKSWMDERARLLEAAPSLDAYRSVRYSQARLWTVSMYTDDGHQAMLGPQLTITGLRVWRKIMNELRLTMAIVQKHGIGQQVTVQGCRFNTGLGIVFVPEDKLRRAMRELDAAVAGRVCLREYHSLVSFLQSLTFVVGMSRSAAYGLYAPLADGASDPDAVLRLTPSVKRQLLSWRQQLLTSAGAPLHAAVDYPAGNPPADVFPSSAPCVFYLRSDASKDGARLPGLGGALGALLWRYPDDSPLSPAELRLPIAVLEFAAYFGTVEVYADLIASDAMVVSEVDALASVDAVSREAARSPLMQHVHSRLLRLPAFCCLDGRHAVGHIYGEANVLADAASRGNYDVAREVASQLGMTLDWRSHGPLLPVLMTELVALHQPPNTALAQTSLGASNLNMTGTPIAHPADVLDTADLERALLLRVLKHELALSSSYGAPPLPLEPPPARPADILPSHHVLAPAPASVLPPQAPYHVVTLHPASDDTAAMTIASLLALDTSSLALRPTSFDLRALCADLYDPSTAQPTRTSQGQNSAWKHWSAWCGVNNTAAWRLTRHVSDTDYHREAILQAGFIRFCHLRQSVSPRSGRRAALVSSALKTLCHIRKMHRDRNFPMCPSPLVTAQVRRLMFEYKSAHGVADMIPNRKEPFTRQILVDVILSTPDGYSTNVGPVAWRTRAGRSLRALVTTMAQTGFRKGEISVTKAGAPCDANCLSRAALSWLLDGRAYAVGEAPPALLRRLRLGDFAVLAPCPSKSDPFDMVWGGDPIWLPFQPDEPLCACAALACVELFDAIPSDVDRRGVALFTNDFGAPFSDAQLDKLLQCLLARVLPPASAKLYSWHSARIFLATTLLASGASHPEIQALCRWQTTDSIKIYARLTSAYYSKLLGGAMAANVCTARAQNLALAAPFIDVQDVRRAAAAAPQNHAHLQPDNIDLNIHPDDDADADEPDCLREPPAPVVCPPAALAAATPPPPPAARRARPPPAPPTPVLPRRAVRPTVARARASYVRPVRAAPRRGRSRPAPPAVERPVAARPSSVAHLSFCFPRSLAGYATYDARPSLRRPPPPRTPIRRMPSS